MPSAGIVAITLHGPGYGLDETECFLSEIAGVAEAVTAGRCPGDLERVRIVERSVNRAARLSALLEEYLPDGKIENESTMITKRFQRWDANVFVIMRVVFAKPHWASTERRTG